MTTSPLTLTIRREDDRLSPRYGQYYYVVRDADGGVLRVKYLDRLAYNRDAALTWATAAARVYDATFVDQRPHPCLDGWSSD